MPTPPPDPNGRPSSTPRAPGTMSANSPGAVPVTPSSTGSTGSHHPGAPAEPLSDLIHGTGSSARRVPKTGTDLLQMLGNPGASPIKPGGLNAAENSDDAPTIITRSHGSHGSPVPLPVGGDAPSIAGRRLGHFELIESIGAGGMAAVLKARDLELGRVVALKILPPEAARDPEGVSRFKQEARAAAMLDHENVARVYFCGEDQGLHFIAFEFVEGENLRQLIDRRGTIPATECVRYMIQVAAGLNHAAERGVVHRDIKPSNIIITPDGRAKIVDMGLARHLDAVNGGVTHSGVTLGTFDYISPEQALDPRRADVRSDIYSLGCAFYHALTGRPPVSEGTAAKKLYAHQHINPLDPRAINPNIPDDLAAVLSGMMAKNPGQRYQTPAELIAHLKGVAERLKLSLDVVASDSTVQAVPASQAIAVEPPRLRFGWMAAVAAVAIAIIAFAISPRPDTRPALPSWAVEPAGKFVDPPINPGNPGTQNPGQPADGVVEVRSVEGLAQSLADPRTHKVHLDAGTYDLRDLPEGIVSAGNDKEELELIGSPTELTKIIVFAAHSASANGPSAAGGLVLRAEKIAIRGIRFEIHSPLFPGDLVGIEGNATTPVGLSIQSSTQKPPQVRLTDCTFTCHDATEDEVVAVAVMHTDVKPVQLWIERCVFSAGKDLPHGGIALQVPPRARVDIDDSGFGPHTAAVQVTAFKDDGTEPAPLLATIVATVKLTRSSFMLDSRGVVVSTASPVAVTAGYCVFAQVGPEQTPLPAVLQAGKLDGTRFIGITGQKNAYCQVNPLMSGTGDDLASRTFDDCKLEGLPFTDAAAVTLAQRPWADQRPLETLAAPEPWAAFRLKIETEPAVFVPKYPDVRVLGAQFHDPRRDLRRAYADVNWPPPQPTISTTEPRQLVWYPSLKDEPLPRDTYNDLGALLRAARSGDTILVRHNGVLPLDDTVEIRVARSATEFKLTFKPFQDSKPILAAPGRDALDQTLFRLFGGDVTFERIQFLLKPSLPKFPQLLAVVSVVGGKACACTFNECVFTLLEEDEAKAAVVQLVPEPQKIMAMPMDKEHPAPDVKFNRCVIRGKGRGIWVRMSRAVKVDISQSLTALDGPLFLAESTGKPSMNPSMNARSSLKLTHVTALVGGPLVELKGSTEKVDAMRTSGLVQMDAEVNACLFAPVPGAGQPLVEMEGIDATEAMRILGWQVQKGNRYANFDAAAVMIVRPGGEGNMPKEWNWNQWIGEFAREPPLAGNPQGRVTFEKDPVSLRDLAELNPADVVLKEIRFTDIPDAKPGDTGADSKVLPSPWGS